MPTYVEIIPIALKSLRERRGWTQQRLAEKTVGKHGGVSDRTIKRIESAKETRRCETKIALSLAEALDVTLEELRYPIHPMIYDAGGDVLIDLSGNDDDDNVRRGLDEILKLRAQMRCLIAKDDAT
jgi:transcriptional regulator with XRE-family HTH domain